ncbi:glucose 1-dehydrogenase [Brevibacillus choshinensis]|uniref:SDR family NAD(P)-dependent oxidoreductase n=1 Tax=Brevibacillus choshinensis TaxID=54911 RepID=UPI002E1C2689|nr:glucose 1-dehydrogenase [Brevibacillus choshinensis]MED4586553.1 glucose 1-dehydrogenase [Brevibacillus choshinensis]MED4785197.1 glucose 1-dehydrogenase [Brevibacillus choshinensis]
MRLQNKIAIVTGAARGIGAAIAHRYAEEGARVVATDISTIGEEVVAEIVSKGGTAVFFQADVSKTADVQALIAFAKETYGVPSVLCNNAAINIPGSVIELEEEVWDRTMEVNVKSMFLTSKYCLPEMIAAGGGSVVNMASANSFAAEPRLSAYVTSKGAIHMLTKQMALDFAADNVRVNCICPGWVDTTFNDAHADLFGGRDNVLKSIADFQPIGRTIQPVEIANVAVFLAADESSAMTGSAVVVDGGLTAK